MAKNLHVHFKQVLVSTRNVCRLLTVNLANINCVRMFVDLQYIVV